MNYKLSRYDASLTTIFLSPFDRMSAAPDWGKALALVGGGIQYAYHDAFIGALFFVFASTCWDYRLGIKVAKNAGAYNAVLAQRGFTAKLADFPILMFVRLFEHYLFVQGFVPDSHGFFATAIGISLFTRNMQSIIDHRARSGARPIPFLGAFVAWVQRVISSLVATRFPPEDPPPPPPDPAAEKTPSRRAADPRPENPQP